MKIGLLTYHQSSNYGAVMQTYATIRALTELGYTVELIDLRQTEPFKIKYLIYFAKVLSIYTLKKKWYPKLSPFFASSADLEKAKLDYDVLLVGSDQVWNPEISKDKYLSYFLDFGDDKVNRYSFSSSFGLDTLSDLEQKKIDRIKKTLGRFTGITVREQTGKRILQEELGLPSTLVVDPTLLHSDYSELTGKIKERDDIICYFLYRTPEEAEAARIVSQKANIKATLISNITPQKGLGYMYPPTIGGWIRSIGGAKLVVTDSFHGLVFSLIYHRNVIVYALDNGRTSRMKDLLKLAGLENRFFTNIEDLKASSVMKEKIDYNEVDKRLQNIRETSWNFLKNMK